MSQVITFGQGGGGGGITELMGNTGTASGPIVTVTTAAGGAWNGTAKFTGDNVSTLGLTFDNSVNLGIGANSLVSITSGGQNTALGISALSSIQSSNANTAIGYESMNSIGSATGGNTALGAFTMQSINGSSAYYNTAVGLSALQALTGTFFNTAIGGEAGKNIQTGNFNTFVGASAARDIPSGINNTAIGAEALQNAGSGCDNNIVIGSTAGANITGANRDNNIIIGNAGAAESNTIRIGDFSTQTANFQAGIAGVTVANTEMVTIDNTTGQLGSQALPSGASFFGTYGGTTILSSTAAILYAPPFGTAIATKAQAQFICPASGSLSNLYVNVFANASTSNVTITLNVNGVNTALVATVTASTTGAFSDLANSVAVNAGDTIQFEIQQSTVGTVDGIISCRFVAS